MGAMNLNVLKSFLAVADGASVTEVANRLGRTQSGISRQIASLEDELGFTVFDRVRGRLLVNRNGKAFLRHARGAVDAVDHLPRAARDIASESIDRVKIAATSGIVFGLLPSAMARYIQARPGLSPSINMYSLEEIVELGRESQFDMLVAPLPLRQTHFELIETINFDLRLVGPAAELANGDGETSLKRLDGMDFISLDPFATYQEGVERSFAEAGISVRFVCETSSVLTAARLVELGIGSAFLDPFVAEAISSSKVVSRRVRPPITHAYGVFAPMERPLSGEAERTLDMIRDVARELA